MLEHESFDNSLLLEKSYNRDIIENENSSMNSVMNNAYRIVIPGVEQEKQLNANQKKVSYEHGKTFFSVLTKLATDNISDKKGYVAVQRNIAALEALMNEKMPMPEANKKGKLTNESIAKCREQVDSSCMVFTLLYNKLVISLDAAIKNCGNDNSDIKRELETIKGICEEERTSFQDKATQYYNYMMTHPKERNSENCRWIDALKFLRADFYDLDSKEFATYHDNSGACTDIFHMKNKNTKEDLWFLKETYAPAENNQEMVNDVMKDDQFMTLSEELKKDLCGYLDAFYVNTSLKERNNFLQALHDTMQIANKPNTFISLFQKNLNILGTKNAKSLARYLKKVNSKDREGVYRLFDKFLRQATMKSHTTGAVAGISGGKSLNNRNVATSRMASLLGLQDLFCVSRMATIRQNGKLIRGSVMENAEGEKFYDYAFHNGKMSFSSEALKEFACVQVMDAICGQVDRHHVNMNAKIIKGEVKTIKCFDNNMSFGTSKYNSFKIHYNNKATGNVVSIGNIKPIEDPLLMALPISFVNRILNLRSEAVEIILCDVLDQKEINCLWSRITALKKHIRQVYRINEDEAKNNQKQFKDVHVEVPEGFDKDDTLRMLKSMKSFVENKRTTVTNIPYQYMPTTNEFEKAIKQREVQLKNNDINGTVSLSIPSKKIRVKRGFF